MKEYVLPIVEGDAPSSVLFGLIGHSMSCKFKQENFYDYWLLLPCRDLPDEALCIFGL